MHFDLAQRKQKGFSPLIIILVISLVMGIAGGAYYFGKSQVNKPQNTQPTITPSASPDETASWKTYINSQVNFSVKYPPDKRLEVSEDKNNIFVAVPNSDYGFAITILENSQKLTPENWIKANFDSQYKDTTINSKRLAIDSLQLKNKQVGDQTAVEVRVEELPSYILVAIPNRDKLLKIVGSTLEQDLFDQILSTFKFTN